MQYGLKNNDKAAFFEKKVLKLGNEDNDNLHPTLMQLLHWKGEPMQMRLKPPYKKDSEGNNIPDFTDPNGRGYYVTRYWYACFKYKGKFYGESLKAEKKDEIKAHDNLVILFENVKLGKITHGTKKKIKLLPSPKDYSEESVGSRKKWIDKFFGEMRIDELSPKILEDFIAWKWGRNEQGIPWAMERSLKGDLIALRLLCKSANENFNWNDLIKDLKVDYRHKDLLPPLTRKQINQAWEHGEKARGGHDFKKSFWIMVWTGIEAMDICDLRPKHFVTIDGEEWLVKDRHKTKYLKVKNVIKIPVLPELKAIIESIPVPIDKNTPYFPNMDNKNCNKAIIKWFTRAGLKGYGAKYIRRHLGAIMMELGYSEAWIGQALAHAVDSEQTKKYMTVRPEKLSEAFNKIAKQG